ncbi:Xaa-Pro peptidase family protein [bacterium]|nr:Xaa-Pro peptidase family protein [bacterium]
MSLSLKEMDRRHSELKKRMKEKGVNILLVFCDTGDFGLHYSNFRYLTNSKVLFGNAALIFSVDEDPVMLMISNLQAVWARQLSWIKDVKISPSLISDIVYTLKSLGLKEKRIGVASLASLPLAWYKILCQEFPSVDLIEMDTVIGEMRYLKSEEEIELVERAAKLCDMGFDRVIKSLKPGMTEFEVLAQLEHPMREQGGDDFCNFIYSGKFGPGIKMIPFAPTGRKEPSRKIQVGDSLLFEVTVRYGGYWAQLVRVLSVGKQNPLLAQLQQIAQQGIDAAVQYFKPGIKLGDAIQAVKKVYESAGKELHIAIGHLCGLDLREATIDLESDILKPGMVLVFHPPIKSGETRMFVGETYVITSEGYRCLQQTPNEPYVV